MEKRIHGNLRSMRHRRVLELYLPKVTYRMKLIPIQVYLYGCIVVQVFFFVYWSTFYVLIHRSYCIDTWAFYDRTRKTTLSKWKAFISLHTRTYKAQCRLYVLYHFLSLRLVISIKDAILINILSQWRYRKSTKLLKRSIKVL